MDDFHMNTTLRDKSYNYSNVSLNNSSIKSTAEQILNVVDWIVICSGLPLTLVAIAAVYSLVRKDHVAPVYIINLLVSDLVQLCCQAAWKAGKDDFFIFCSYIFGLSASVGFMVCVSLERYLMITQPLWYRFRRNIKNSVAVCVVVWILSFIISFLFRFYIHNHIRDPICAIYLLLPFPLFIFCLVGTIKALSAARSVPADEKRRIVAILVVVLLIYTLLFVPKIVLLLAEEAINNQTFKIICFMLVRISPLTDLILYIFIRKGTTDKLLALLCCCKINQSADEQQE
ncbi:G-protein coupled receptor 4-like [Melanotaenia boesemani]|uniref:G-protein coupled receptor 4-like n=1 Tax=Melanotaenia boesemani TaxID=1250792 RepID=UPI001C04ED78|nr:G-protein coupled receptor 4-like [Melanotaenia boesemani]XP_041866851.1 G-protein coupled receptor 4-like [Melanotaenia boesemani]